MAFTTEDYQPRDYMPNFALGEWQYAHLIGAGESQAFTGGGEFGDVHNNVAVAGTVSIHDVAAGGTADATNLVALYDTTALGPLKKTGPWSVSRGLRIITSAATNNVTVALRGRQTISTRTYP